jgi:hypothetical protein
VAPVPSHLPVRSSRPGALASPPVAEAPADLVLDPIQGEGYPLHNWLSSFPLALVAIDPYTHESAWILETAGRLLRHYTQADVRVGWLVTADDDDCRRFLGPWADEFITFADPERTAVVALGVERLPALVQVMHDRSLRVANGWDPDSWRDIASYLSSVLSWSRPMIPRPGDPLPYEGTSAKG